MSEPLKIERDELFGDEIDRAIARRRAQLGATPPEAPPVSRLRRLLYSSLFYLPLASTLAAVLVWAVLEPHLNDEPRVAGEVVMVNRDPFAVRGLIALTVAGHELLVGDETHLDPGVDGQPAFARRQAIAVGDVVEAAGLTVEARPGSVLVAAIRPATAARAAALGVRMRSSKLVGILFFPVTAIAIALFVLLAEAVTSRNWGRAIPRLFVGVLLAAVFSTLASIPGGLIFFIGRNVFEHAAASHETWFVTLRDLGPLAFLVFIATRSCAWACIGAGLGVGMNLVGSTRAQLRNAVLGGALGGALGGLFFDPIDRFARSSLYGDAGFSRLVGLIAVGLCVGLFLALVERLARTAWLRVRTGPLAGKAFVLHRTPTTIGSAPEAHVFLFKDTEIDPRHAQIHRIGSTHEVEDLGSRTGTAVGGRKVRRRRLVSGDQIVIGSTVLEFEERARRRA